MNRLDTICKVIFNVYEAHTAAVYKKEGEFLKCMSFFTLSKNFSSAKLLHINETLPGWVVKHKEPLIIPNFDKSTQTLGYYKKDEEIKSFMAHPIEDCGVICIDSKKKYSFTDKEKNNLKNFVPLILEEIAQEDYGSELEEKINELNTNRRIFSIFRDLLSGRITIEEVLGEALLISKGDLCFIGMERGKILEIRDAVGQKDKECIGKRCSVGQSVASSVIEGEGELILPYDSGYLKEKPLIYEGETFKARQFFGFPLVVDEMVFGVAGFATMNQPLSEKSIGVLRDFSVLLSMYYSAKWTKEYLEKLRDFDPVTGALQFHYFLRTANELIEKKIDFGLIAVKLLGLNTFCREKGIDFADEILRKAYYLIKNVSGDRSFVARKGGGKFYVALPRRDRLSVKNTEKLICYSIYKAIYEKYDGKTRFEKKEDGVRVKVVFFPEDGVELFSLLEKIDG